MAVTLGSRLCALRERGSQWRKTEKCASFLSTNTTSVNKEINHVEVVEIANISNRNKIGVI